MTTTTTEGRVRQLTPAELDARYPIDCTIDAKGNVRVTKLWEQQNLVRVRFPDGFGITATFWMHKAAAPHFLQWFDLIAKAGFKRDVMTFNGSYVPRLKRGANVPKTTRGLSRHARGLAIDINEMWNPMGKPGPKAGEAGSVERLVRLANDVGLVWGGDWHGASCDPQHFEIGTFDP